MAELEEVVEQIDDAAMRAAEIYLERVTRCADPKFQARQLQTLAIVLAVMAKHYGVGEDRLQRLLGAACGRVIGAEGCTTTEVAEA